jgi:hypothetical protein
LNRKKTASAVVTAAVLGLAIIAGSGAPVSAATLNLIGGTTINSLPAGFGVLSDSNGNVDRNDSLFGNLPTDTSTAFTVTNYFDSKTAAEGLDLVGDSQVRFTYLGKEAGFNNTATSVGFGGGSFVNSTAVFGDTLTGDFLSGLLSFAFNEGGGGSGTANNDGLVSTGLTLAFGELFNGGRSVIAMFGDGGGNDNDLDDIVVRIDVVPLPAGLLLLLSGLLGLGFLGRYRSKIDASAS